MRIEQGSLISAKLLAERTCFSLSDPDFTSPPTSAPRTTDTPPQMNTCTLINARGTAESRWTGEDLIAKVCEVRRYDQTWGERTRRNSVSWIRGLASWLLLNTAVI